MSKSLFAICLFTLMLAACSPNNISEDNSLEKYFKENGATGTFGIFDNGKGQFTIYNVPRFSDSAYLPGGTFNIVSSLVGLEIRMVKDSATVFPNDSMVKRDPLCNRAMSMNEAFRQDCGSFYHTLIQGIGRDTLQHWIDTLGYGKKDSLFRFKSDFHIQHFSKDNTIKVTADEQMGLVKRLYFDQLPYTKRSQRIVREMMSMENNANYQLSYTSGQGTTEQGNVIAWVMGWIEENRHPYFFVLQLQNPDTRNVELRTLQDKMLKDVLKELGFLEGKK